VQCHIKAAIGLVLGLGLLTGCAGLNELSDGELLGQRQAYSSPSRYAAAAEQQTVPSGYAESSMELQEVGSSMEPARPVLVQSAAIQSDPINAPPPPMQSEAVLSSSQAAPQTPSSAPLMLVPPPGSAVAEPAGDAVRVNPIQQAPILAEREVSAQVMEAQRPAMPVVVQNERPTEVAPVVISSRSPASTMRGREFIPASLSPTGPMSGPVRPGEIPLTPDQMNVVSRFNILNDLRDMGLVTQDEYTQRRSKNIGAILPYTHDAPAIGLQRQVPNQDVITSRLSALKRSVEMRAITPRQHALERSMILDGLLPSNPVRQARREPPPEDVISAAATLGHLERLRFDGVITDQEFEQERAAIDRFLQTGMLDDDEFGDDAMQNDAAAPNESMQPIAEVSGLGVHLASYRSEAAARKGWGNIEKKFSAPLSGLSPVIRRVDLGAGKGTYYRLFAGPVGDSGKANSICQQLKRSDQYCDPLRYDG
jgi:hypothetical protein